MCVCVEREFLIGSKQNLFYLPYNILQFLVSIPMINPSIYADINDNQVLI